MHFREGRGKLMLAPEGISPCQFSIASVVQPFPPRMICVHVMMSSTAQIVQGQKESKIFVPSKHASSKLSIRKEQKRSSNFTVIVLGRDRM